MGGATINYEVPAAGKSHLRAPEAPPFLPGAAPSGPPIPGVSVCGCILVLQLVAGGLCLAGAADPDPAAVARRSFQAAETAYKTSPDTTTNAWQFARACFDLADCAAASPERANLAQQGIKSAQYAITLQPKSAPAHYYLGMDLGQLARTKSLGALKLVNQMEREFKLARELDEHFDFAGPDRNLGLLYRDAPSLTSVGSRSKARVHLRRAVELAPAFPENRLSLLEAYVKWGEAAEARDQLNSLDELWAAARKTLTGEAWTASWTDWEQRLKQAHAKLDEQPKTASSRERHSK